MIINSKSFLSIRTIDIHISIYLFPILTLIKWYQPSVTTIELCKHIRPNVLINSNSILEQTFVKLVSRKQTLAQRKTNMAGDKTAAILL